MATPITSLISGIESEAETFLGASYSKISYGIDLLKNRSRGAKKAYAVLPSGATQEESIGALVVNQEFSLKLTNSYNPGKVNDHNQQSLTNSLYDLVYDLYEQLVTNKCGQPSLVMNTFGLDVGKPEYLDEEVIIIEFSFTVKHRLS